MPDVYNGRSKRVVEEIKNNAFCWNADHQLKSMTSARPRNALVIGGTCHIGQAIALLLSSNGVNVTVTYCSSKESADTLVQENPQITAKHFDLAWSKEKIHQFVRTITSENGSVAPNILVISGAAIKPSIFEEVDEAMFDLHYASIVRGPSWLIQVCQCCKTKFCLISCRHSLHTLPHLQESYFSLPLWPEQVSFLTSASYFMLRQRLLRSKLSSI